MATLDPETCWSVWCALGALALKVPGAMEADSFARRASESGISGISSTQSPFRIRLSYLRIVLTSGLSWAYILGEVCAIVSEMTAESQRFRKKMHHLCLAFGVS